MRVYVVKMSDGSLWRISPFSFSFFTFETTDRRIARKAVRAIRRNGYHVSF